MSGAEKNQLVERSHICWFVLVILQQFGCLWISTEQWSKFSWTWLVIGFTCALSLSAEGKAGWHHRVCLYLSKWSSSVCYKLIVESSRSLESACWKVAFCVWGRREKLSCWCSCKLKINLKLNLKVIFCYCVWKWSFGAWNAPQGVTEQSCWN